MNNSYNYADFIGMNLKSDDHFETQAYQAELQPVATQSQDQTIDNRIENMLFSHHKYHIYCE